MKPIRIAIVGAGSRGWTYSQFALVEPGRMVVTAVADPNPAALKRMAEGHHLPPEACYQDWRDLPENIADAVFLCTQDQDHVEPAIALAQKGYALLIEKPLAPTEEECRRAVAEISKTGVTAAVCHVLRYTRYTQRLQALIQAGTIGEIVNIQHFEPVGWWHFAHSFVRGNWRNETLSSPVLLAKCCHDVDWLLHVMGRPVSRVSSFGGLHHFRPDNRPDGAADRCLDCSVEAECPYSAKRFYLDELDKPWRRGWARHLTPEVNHASVAEALRSGPYGRCVYACDNDVADQQVVNFEFVDGATASFTMSAFTPAAHRRTRISGTRGYIEGDGRYLEILNFVTGESSRIDTEENDGQEAWPAESPEARLRGHGGGDYGVVDAFLKTLSGEDPEALTSGLAATLAGHLLVFQAERARTSGQVVTVADI